MLIFAYIVVCNHILLIVLINIDAGQSSQNYIHNEFIKLSFCKQG